MKSEDLRKGMEVMSHTGEKAVFDRMAEQSAYAICVDCMGMEMFVLPRDLTEIKNKGG